MTGEIHPIMRFALIGASLIAGATFTGCKPLPFKGVIQSSAYIVGKNNLRAIDASRADAMTAPETSPESLPALTQSLEDKIRQVAAATVLIVAPLRSGETRFCSGAAYTTDNGVVIVTNRHCFATSKEHKAEDVPLDPWACEKTQVYLDFDLSTALPGRRAACAKGSIKTNARLDLATFKLEGDTPAQTLQLRKIDPTPSDRLATFIVHFPDVEEKRIRLDLAKFPGAPATAPRMTVSFEECQTAGYFKEEHYKIDPSLPYGLRHTCDMIKGSSGSSLIDAATGESLGVNWGGIRFGEDPTAETFNIATRATLVTSFLTMPETDLESFLAAIADQPLAAFVGDGTSDAKVSRTSGRKNVVGGCAMIQETANASTGDGPANDPEKHNHSLWQDLGWLGLGFAVGAGLALQRKRRRQRAAASGGAQPSGRAPSLGKKPAA
ncbi:MAG: hypothetical protein RIQ81_276 [Pseudomonadota bacterium]